MTFFFFSKKQMEFQFKYIQSEFVAMNTRLAELDKLKTAHDADVIVSFVALYFTDIKFS